MKKILETDLILNADGSVYHLNLLPEQISDHIITVGDPERVEKISQYFDSVVFKKKCREFVTHRGFYKGKDLTVMSTGMGTDNIEIFLTELDALANVDLTTRTIKENKKSLNIIRIGTSGSLQEDIPVGTHLVSENGIGMDTLMCFYEMESSLRENEISGELQDYIGIPFSPYCVSGSELLKNKLAFDMVAGNTVTCPGFYGPQGRNVRSKLKFEGLMEQFTDFRSKDFRLTNLEMETAGYYAMGRMLGHEVISLNAILANRPKNEFSQDAEQVVNSLIQKVLDRL